MCRSGDSRILRSGVEQDQHRNLRSCLGASCLPGRVFSAGCTAPLTGRFFGLWLGPSTSLRSVHGLFALRPGGAHEPGAKWFLALQPFRTRRGEDGAQESVFTGWIDCRAFRKTLESLVCIPSGAKAPLILCAFSYGLKPVPFKSSPVAECA